MVNYEEIISILNSDKYYNLESDIMKLVNDEGFLKRIIKIHNPMIFDRFIKLCEFKIDTAAIHEERNKFIKKSIDNLRKENIYNFFELEEMEESRKDRYASRYLSEYIVMYYFQDNFYNFMTNFYLMSRYLSGERKDLVSLDHIKLYEHFLNITDISFDEKIALFNNNLDKDLMGMFYDDVNTVREDSHKKLVEASLKLKKDNGIYKEDLSKKYDVDVYYLDGEDFYGFVRGFALKDGIDNEDYIYSKRRRLGYSFSYIGKYNIGTIGSNGEGLLLYYDNIDYRKIMYVHHTDMHTGGVEELKTYLTDKENEILTPASLVADTVNYNEVYIKANEEGIKPTAIVCYDTITDKELAFAHQYNLSILLINTSKYYNKTIFDDSFEDYTYII